MKTQSQKQINIPDGEEDRRITDDLVRDVFRVVGAYLDGHYDPRSATDAMNIARRINLRDLYRDDEKPLYDEILPIKESEVGALLRHLTNQELTAADFGVNREC